ncbi:hypothetical protein BASA61_008759 [Batrachochytrium salamandrivorans]|nr:hypothetical protein BASA61_008759 [Batrachochytrium salamandrivorans]
MLQPSPSQRGLSEKYSNGVDITLMSLLSARSYQPALNSYKESATLMSLKRRANSGGNSGGSGIPLESTFEYAKLTIGSAFGKEAFNCVKLFPTIDKVGDGVVSLHKDIKRAADMIGGSAGEMLTAYFRRALYVDNALQGWIRDTGKNVISIIKSGLGVAEYSKVDLLLRQTAARLTNKIQAGFKAAAKAVSYLLRNIGFTNKNMETIHASFGDIFRRYMMFFEELKPLLVKFPDVKAFSGYIANMCVSLNKFLTDQQQIYGKFVKALEASPPKY